MPWAELRPDLGHLISVNDHVELWINPYSGNTLVSARNRRNASELLPTSVRTKAVTFKRLEFKIVRNFAQGPVKFASVHGDLILKAREHDLRGCGDALSQDLIACACQLAYRKQHGGKGPPPEFPYADTCTAAIQDSTLLSNVGFNMIADYPLALLVGGAHSANYLGSEPNVPIAETAQLVETYLNYANSVASGERGERNFYTTFGSIRFSDASQHFMAPSFGGPRAYIEAPTLLGSRRVANEQNTDQRQLIDGWNEYVLQRHPAARLHLGLQNGQGWNFTVIQQRFPEESWRMFTGMDATYDSNDSTRSAFEELILGPKNERVPLQHSSTKRSQP